MAKWVTLAKFKGYYESEIIPISLDGDGALTKISWVSDEPIGTSINIETIVSFDGGFDWRDWKRVSNGSSIPDISFNTSLQNAMLKYRVIMDTKDKNITPKLYSISFEFEPVIYIDNRGDVTIRPELWITKMGNGDFSIINTTNGNSEFKFVDLIDNETIYVNGYREQIETNLANIYRYSNFNDNYIELIEGVNVLRVQGNAKLQFRYQFKMLQG